MMIFSSGQESVGADDSSVGLIQVVEGPMTSTLTWAWKQTVNDITLV